MSHKELIIWLSKYIFNSKIFNGSGDKCSSTSSHNPLDLSLNLNRVVDSEPYR